MSRWHRLCGLNRPSDLLFLIGMQRQRSGIYLLVRNPRSFMCFFPQKPLQRTKMTDLLTSTHCQHAHSLYISLPSASQRERIYNGVKYFYFHITVSHFPANFCPFLTREFSQPRVWAVSEIKFGCQGQWLSYSSYPDRCPFIFWEFLKLHLRVAEPLWFLLVWLLLLFPMVLIFFYREFVYYLGMIKVSFRWYWCVGVL